MLQGTQEYLPLSLRPSLATATQVLYVQVLGSPHRPRAWALPPLRLNSAPLGGPHPQSQVLRERLVPDQPLGLPEPLVPHPEDDSIFEPLLVSSTTRTPGQWGGGSWGLLRLPGTPHLGLLLDKPGLSEKRTVSPSLKNHSAPGKHERLPASPVFDPQHPSPIFPISMDWVSHFKGQTRLGPACSLAFLFPMSVLDSYNSVS